MAKARTPSSDLYVEYANFHKVCLSLLGTYAGQPWIPNQSTLLQVLVSIQSMIFCDQPFFNEPGNERYANAKASSNQYNAVIHASTMYHAMVDWMKNIETSIWKPVLMRHFVEAAPRILSVTKRWADDSGRVPALGYDPYGARSMIMHNPHGPHANPYHPGHVSGAFQLLSKTIAQFLSTYGRR